MGGICAIGVVAECTALGLESLDGELGAEIGHLLGTHTGGNHFEWILGDLPGFWKHTICMPDELTGQLMKPRSIWFQCRTATDVKEWGLELISVLWQPHWP